MEISGWPQVSRIPDQLPDLEMHLHFLRSRGAETELGREKRRSRTLKVFINYTCMLPLSNHNAYLENSGAHGR